MQHGIAETKLFWYETGYTSILLKTFSIRKNTQDSYIDLTMIFLSPLKFQRL